MKELFDKSTVAFGVIITLVTIAFYVTVNTIGVAMQNNGNGWVAASWLIYASVVASFYAAFRMWNNKDNNGGSRY